MPEVETAFATPEELRARWRAMPAIPDDDVQVKLLDASQYLVDVCPAALTAPRATLRRIVCQVVKRSIEGDEHQAAGVESIQTGAGPYQETIRPLNPHGDYYLTSGERRALGCGRQRAFAIDLLGSDEDAR